MGDLGNGGKKMEGLKDLGRGGGKFSGLDWSGLWREERERDSRFRGFWDRWGSSHVEMEVWNAMALAVFGLKLRIQPRSAFCSSRGNFCRSIWLASGENFAAKLRRRELVARARVVRARNFGARSVAAWAQMNWAILRLPQPKILDRTIFKRLALWGC